MNGVPARLSGSEGYKFYGGFGFEVGKGPEARGQAGRVLYKLLAGLSSRALLLSLL